MNNSDRQAIIESMRDTPITGQECIDHGWHNDSMGELFSPEKMYCAQLDEGTDSLIIVPVK